MANHLKQRQRIRSASRSPLSFLQKSTLRKLDQMIRDDGANRKTYAEIVEWLGSHGVKTSKSAVGRYAKHVDNSCWTPWRLKRHEGLTSRKTQLFSLLKEIVDLFDSLDGRA